ncbi:MAG: hypothetical protein KDE09_06900 [Anaerolineales bacterium]|nr:hypothetical protein [Anaerolineales bacterium]
MAKIALAATAGNLGDLSIALEIARDLQEDVEHPYEIDFISYGIRYSNLISQAGFKARYPPPYRFAPFAPDVGRLIKLVEHELKWWQAQKPAAIINKHEISPIFSARLAGIPLIWVLNYAWTRPCFATGRIGPNPLALIFHPDHMMSAEAYLEPFRQVARHFGLPEPADFHELYTGEQTWVLDIPAVTGEPLPAGYHYIGPHFAQFPGDIPAELSQLDRNRPIIYFSMGSSTHLDKLLPILQSFRLRPDYQVIAPVRWRLSDHSPELPPNVILTDRVPAHLVNPLADVAVIHGGSGTIGTACYSGTPFVGFANFLEQAVNIDLIVARGAAKRLSFADTTPPEVVAAVDELLASTTARAQMAELQGEFRRWQHDRPTARLLTHYLASVPAAA